MITQFSFRAALVCLLALCSPVLADEPPQPLIVAHRGLLLHAPENTLASFRACLDLRLGFEFDVAKTKDGHLVCIHDDTVDRTTSGTGKVDELSLAEIRRLDAGSWFDRRFADEKVPTIDEVFRLLAEHKQHDVLVAVDLKATDVEEEVVRLAKLHHVLDRLLFIGLTIADEQVRDKLKQAANEVRTAIVANDAKEFTQTLTATNADWVYFRFLPSKEQVAAVHSAKKRGFIAGKTVSGNQPENWKLVGEVGIDGILTDYPLELRTLHRK